MALVLTQAQMRAVDGAIIARLGLPGLVLMENAGRGVADLIARERPALPGLDVRIVCGAGQNGGDGFVMARHLLARKASVRVFLALPADKIAGDAAINARVLRAIAADCIVDFSRENEAATWTRALAGADVVVDALFGTGLRAQVSGVPAAAIAGMNAADALRVAVDVPSGLNADGGDAHGPVVQAHLTATMGALKLGLVVNAESPVGRVEVVDLGVSIEAVLPEIQGPFAHWIDRDMVAPLLPRRAVSAHKGSSGHLLVIAGSSGKTGAALLAARAGLRAGAGLCTIATTAAARTAIDAKVVAEMTASFCDGDDADDSSFARIAGLAGSMKAGVIGPGIPTGDGMRDIVRRLLVELPIALVVDADALNLLGGDRALLAHAKAPRILTPHPGEMARLLGSSTEDVQRERVASARQVAAETGAVVVLKGARTVIALADGTVFVNPTANPALATAGSGDVLAGTVGALLARGVCARDAAMAGAYLHGTAGEIATQTLGSTHVVATDLPDAIARACEALRSV